MSAIVTNSAAVQAALANAAMNATKQKTADKPTSPTVQKAAAAVAASTVKKAAGKDADPTRQNGAAEAPPTEADIDDLAAKKQGSAATASELKTLQTGAKESLSQLLSTEEGAQRAATALDGKTAKTRTAAEQAKIDTTFAALKNGEMKDPVFKGARTATVQDIETGKAPKNALPPGVDGAFVAGKNGQPGTALIADKLSAPEKQKAALEEQSEVLADFARGKGVKVAEGDAGNRLRLAAGGNTVDPNATPGLFKQDEVGHNGTVNLNGQQVDAKLQAANVRTLAISNAQAAAYALSDFSGNSGSIGVQRDNLRAQATNFLRRLRNFSAASANMANTLGWRNLSAGEKKAVERIMWVGLNEAKANSAAFMNSAIQLSRNIANNTDPGSAPGASFAMTMIALGFFGIAGAAGGLLTLGSVNTQAGVATFVGASLPGGINPSVATVANGIGLPPVEFVKMGRDVQEWMGRTRQWLGNTGQYGALSSVNRIGKGVKATGRRITNETIAQRSILSLLNDHSWSHHDLGRLQKEAATLRRVGYGADAKRQQTARPAGRFSSDIVDAGVRFAFWTDGYSGLTRLPKSNHVVVAGETGLKGKYASQIASKFGQVFRTGGQFADRFF